MRQYLSSILQFALPALVVFASLYYCFIYHIKPYQLGDLERLGGFVIPRSNQVENYPDETTNNFTYISKVYDSDIKSEECNIEFNVVNFGDSFSGQGKNGYVNYLGKYLNENILNLSSARYNAYDSAIAMLNNGTLSKLNTKVVIIESGERAIIGRLTGCNLKASHSANSLVKKHYSAKKKAKQSKIKMICSQAKEVRNWIMLKVSNNPVRHAKLNKPLFSHSEYDMYFYRDDLLTMSIDDELLSKIEQKLLSLKQMFEEKGITLIILCIPDKYDAYQEYIKDNKYEKKIVLDQLDQLEICKNFFYSAKPVISKLIKDGVKDVYIYGDTHWSPIASQAVGLSLSEFINVVEITKNQQ